MGVVKAPPGRFDWFYTVNFNERAAKTLRGLPEMGEFCRVIRRGGIIAVKAFNATLLQFLPLDRAFIAWLA